VVEALIDSLKSTTPRLEVEETMAEKARPQDLLSGDFLLLASSTWNTGGIEGQLNPRMWALLQDKAKTLDLAGKPCACIGLGDHRYFYTARLVYYLERWNNQPAMMAFDVVLQMIRPYGQEEVVRVWGKQLADVSKSADWS
jgi:flavodoxin I